MQKKHFLYVRSLFALLSIISLTHCGENSPTYSSLKDEQPKEGSLNIHIQRNGDILSPHSKINNEEVSTVRLPFKDYLQEVLRVNNALKSFRSRVFIAEHKTSSVGTVLEPQVSFITNYTALTNNAVGANGAGQGGARTVTVIDMFDFGITLKKILYDFGKVRSLELSTALQENVAIEDYRRALNKLLEDATLVYLSVLNAQSEMNTAKDLVTVRLAHLGEVEAMYRNGTVPKQEYLRARSELNTSQQQLATAEQSHQQAINNLFVLLQKDPHQQAPVLDEFDVPPPPQDRASALSQALQKRSELVGMRWSIKAAEAFVSYAESGLAPTISLQAKVGDTFVNAYQTGLQWNVQLQIAVPLWDGGLTAAETAQAKEKVEQAKYDLDDITQNIKGEVENQYTFLNASWKRLEFANQSYIDAKEVERLTTVRFKLGLATNFDVLDAQNLSNQAQLRYLQEKLAYLSSHARWKRIISSDFPVPVPGPRTEVPENLPNGPTTGTN